MEATPFGSFCLQTCLVLYITLNCMSLNLYFNRDTIKNNIILPWTVWALNIYANQFNKIICTCQALYLKLLVCWFAVCGCWWFEHKLEENNKVRTRRQIPFFSIHVNTLAQIDSVCKSKISLRSWLTVELSRSFPTSNCRFSSLLLFFLLSQLTESLQPSSIRLVMRWNENIFRVDSDNSNF